MITQKQKNHESYFDTFSASKHGYGLALLGPNLSFAISPKTQKINYSTQLTVKFHFKSLLFRFFSPRAKGTTRPRCGCLKIAILLILLISSGIPRTGGRDLKFKRGICCFIIMYRSRNDLIMSSEIESELIRST